MLIIVKINLYTRGIDIIETGVLLYFVLTLTYRSRPRRLHNFDSLSDSIA